MNEQVILEERFFPNFSSALQRKIQLGWFVKAIRINDDSPGASFGFYWALLEKR